MFYLLPLFWQKIVVNHNQLNMGGGATLFNFSQIKEIGGFNNKDDNIHKSESVVQTNINTCRLSDWNNQNVNV